MPLYTYLCKWCQQTRVDLRTIAERDKGPKCDRCKPARKMKRQMDAVHGVVKNPAAGG